MKSSMAFTLFALAPNALVAVTTLATGPRGCDPMPPTGSLRPMEWRGPVGTECHHIFGLIRRALL